MCGIAGIMRFDGRPVDPALIQAMTDRLVHRGPDGHGAWLGPSVGLGHRRLSIIDLAGSLQPMASVDDRLHIAFNGEILNYRDLRTRTRYPFRTQGDTEVLLALYGELGPSFVDRLRGQFAFALHDRERETLTLVRDRIGILPLYVFRDERLLAFASEIKALLPALPARPDVDRSALADYLTHRSVSAPRTLFEGVEKLPPGHRLEVAADGTAKLERWWSLPAVDTSTPVSPGRAVSLVSEALDTSVRESLEADVPVGAYLSGGVDSSLITALIQRHSPAGHLHTFSAGFDHPATDEVGHARRVSEFLGTDHHEVTVTPADFERLWPMLTWHRDAPVSEPADVAVFRLAETARQHVKVVLSGEGSDELFAGYPKYRWARATAWAGIVPHSLRRMVTDEVERHMPPSTARARIAIRAFGAGDRAERLDAWFSPFTAAERRALLGPAASPATTTPLATGDPVRQMLYADCHAWLADNLLERGDRMSMAASLELRPPFLDHRVVELAFSLPSHVKLRNGETKWVVKEVARDLLPPGIADRPKAGFRVPLADWFRGSLRDFAHDRLLDRSSFVTHALDRHVVAELLERHASGRRNEDIRIWTLLSLEMWHERFRSELAGRRVQRGLNEPALKYDPWS